MRDDSRYDFYIVTNPVHGSHMLASALDSHPEIQCRGEKGFRDHPDVLGVGPGRIRGCITHMKAFTMTREGVSLDDVDKLIVLTRGNPERLNNFTKGRDRLVVSYEELTYSEHVDTLSESSSIELCMYLGVDVRILVPAFKKNAVSKWRGDNA